jgi:hypothetical protein
MEESYKRRPRKRTSEMGVKRILVAVSGIPVATEKIQIDVRFKSL